MTAAVTVRFCPACAAEATFVQEYWVARDRHLVLWCASCGLTCTVVLGALVGTEPEH
ncbi:hypothetical protein [Pseudonocardia sp.]|uniref:hypothetical protein n=1 Tax=Pseudonocardia sp. TaxID=60912 RepID=UPI003D0D0DAC